jgi:hypothetical protein
MKATAKSALGEIMRVRLEIVEGPAAGKSYTFRDGEAITVGRTEWAECAVREDSGLEKVHFEIFASADECRVRGLHGAGITFGGEPAVEIRLRDGDRFAAGKSTFAICFDGAGAIRPGSGAGQGQGSAAAPGALADTPPASPSFSLELADEIGLGEDAMTLLKGLAPGTSADAAVAALDSVQLHRDAVLLQARILENRRSVWWAVVCARRALGDKVRLDDSAALKAAEQWVIDPSEANRRAAEIAARERKFEGPAAFAAMAVFWSGDNLAPEGLPKVDVPVGLAARGVAAALLMAAPIPDPLRIPAALSEYLATGRSIARGESPWPPQPPGTGRDSAA